MISRRRDGRLRSSDEDSAARALGCGILAAVAATAFAAGVLVGLLASSWALT